MYMYTVFLIMTKNEKKHIVSCPMPAPIFDIKKVINAIKIIFVDILTSPRD